MAPRVPGVDHMKSFYGSVLQASAATRRLEQAVKRLESTQRAQPGSPIDQFIFMSYATRDDGLFDGTYDLWRVKRIAKILEICGLDHFEGKRVLELGAGHGDMGALIASLGAEVTCVDGRVENLNFGRLKHRDVAGLTFAHMNLDDDFRTIGQFDLVLHLGLLYHIADVEKHLGWCFELTDDVLLESVVCDSTDPNKIFVIDERSEVNEEALSGKGSRPSPFYIERVAANNGFSSERIFSSDLNSGVYVYDWEHRNDDDLGGFEKRRFWRMQRN